METASATSRPASFACSACPATFGRQEHLHRHATSVHATNRAFPCISCAQAFTRRDALLRHLKSCKAVSASDLPPPAPQPQRRGRKRKSCDACARQKRACNGTQPCLACFHRRQDCSYTEIEPESEPVALNNTAAIETWLSQAAEVDDLPEPNLDYLDVSPKLLPQRRDLADGGPESIAYDLGFEQKGHHAVDQSDLGHFHQASSPPQDSTPRLNFLANFTSTNGLASSFECGTVKQRREFVEAVLWASNDVPSTAAALSAKTRDVVNATKLGLEAHSRRQGTGMSWSDAMEMACGGFFAPSNLRRFLASYWALWHPNCPIVHKPTFHEESAPAMLIAVMALIGACLSPEEGDRDAALAWLDPVEYWVFSVAEFRDDPIPYNSDTNDLKLRERLNALRTAYCVILLQTWEGNEDAKRRARRSRYTDIIGVFRSFCSRDIIHGDLKHYLSEEDVENAWRRFAITEELIRTLTYVVLLDTAYVIFNNTPPRMALREARVELCCPEACFQVEDPQTWHECVGVWASSEIGSRQPTIAQVATLIWTNPITPPEWMALHQMSTLNFFTIVHPLHLQLFHARCHPIPGSQTQLMRQALDNWRLAWLNRTGIQGLHEEPPVTADGCWKRIGFSKHAPEFWCFADLILTSSEQLRGGTFDQEREVNNGLLIQLLDRYDVTDMRQVHDLVNAFGSLSIAT